MNIYLALCHDKYVTGSNGIHNEMQICHRLVKEVAYILRNHGHNAYVGSLTECTSVEGSNRAKAIEANKLDIDLYLSIHANAFKDSNARGCEFITYDSDPFTKDIGKSICSNLEKIGIPFRRQIINPQFHEIYMPNAPSIILETHFVTNPEDCKIIDDLTWSEYGHLIANGIDSSIPIIKKSNPIEEPKDYEIRITGLTQKQANDKTYSLMMEGYTAKFNKKVE